MLNYSPFASWLLLYEIATGGIWKKAGFLTGGLVDFILNEKEKKMAISRKQITPYVIGRPIHEPELFFGRESLFRFVEDNLIQGSQVILLHGQRRIGKSSVLAQIPNFVMPDRFAFVLFDLQDKNALSVGAVLHRLAKEIRDNLQLSPEKIKLPSVAELENKKEIFSESFLPQVVGELEDKNLVLLLDEFDVLSNYNPNSADEHFFPYLQSLIAGHQQLFIIPVVGRRVEDMPKLLSLFRRAPQWEIGLLDDRSAKELIVKPAEGVLEYEEEAIAAILELSAGHPYFTQVICFAVFGEARLEDRWRASRTDVEKVADKAIEIAEGGLQWFRDGLPVVERVVFSAVAEAQQIAAAKGDRFGGEPISLLKEYGVVETEALIEAGGRLVDWGFLDSVDSELPRQRFPRYKFIVELVRRWLVRRYPLRDEIWELEKISSEASRIYELGAEFVQNKVFLKNALNLYEQVLEINPNHFKVLFDLGGTYLKVERFKEAAAIYKRLYKVNPLRAEDGLVKSLLGYGSQLIEEGEAELAREQFREVLEIEPDNETALKITLKRKIRDVVHQKGKYMTAYVNVGNCHIGDIINDVKDADTLDEVEQENLAETVTEVQEILQQLSKTYPTNTVTEKIVIAAEASKQIEANPTLKKRLISAAKEGALAAIEKRFDNPIGTVFVATIKGWQENES